MTIDPYALKLYTDGNAYNNPGGTGGFAMVAEYPESFGKEPELILAEGFFEATNNRMELHGCIAALEYVAKMGKTLGVERVQIVTDSKYVHENQNGAVRWRSRGWTNFAGRPVENVDLWKRYLTVRSQTRIRVDIVWSKGKKSPVLKLVDKSAKAAGLNPTRVDRGFRPGKVSRSRLGRSAAQMMPVTGQEANIRVYRTTLAGRTGHKVHFELLDDDGKESNEKFVAYTTRLLVDDLHRQHQYRVLFNSDRHHPQIVKILTE